MPHATMDPERKTGVGGQSQDVYYTLQPVRAGNMHQDIYGSLPGHINQDYNNFPTSQNLRSGSTMPHQSHHYGTLPSQHSRLPSYNAVNNGLRSAPMSGFNTLPAQGSQYGTLPSHADGYSSHTLPAQHKDQFTNRQLPAPSLTRHAMKILQVPMMTIADEANREPMTMRGSPSPSPSPSSTISDSVTAPSPSPQAQSGVIHMVAMAAPPRSDQDLSPAETSHVVLSRPASYSQGTFPISDNIEYQRFPPADRQTPAFPHSGNNNGGQMQGFPPSGMMSQGFPHSHAMSQQGFPQSANNGMVHAATLPHRSSAIPNHVQHRPSPSSSPSSSSSLPATLPHSHQHQHHQQHHQPLHHHPSQQHHQPQHQQPTVNPSPSPSPVLSTNGNERSQPLHQPSMTTSLQIHDQPSLPVAIPTNNNYNTFAGPASNIMTSMPHMVEKPNLDFSGTMRSMQEDMARLQRQMADQFRNMQVGAPLAMTNPIGTFPDFPSIQPPGQFPQPPAYSDLPVQAIASTLALSTPSLIEPDFGTVMSSDMRLGQPVVEDTLDGRGGKKSLKLNLDMHEFTPDEVKVRTDRNRLEVTAHHEEKDPNRITCRVFKQQYQLPENTRMAKLQYNMTPEGELKVEGTVKPRHRVKWAADTLTK